MPASRAPDILIGIVVIVTSLLIIFVHFTSNSEPADKPTAFYSADMNKHENNVHNNNVRSNNVDFTEIVNHALSQKIAHRRGLNPLFAKIDIFNDNEYRSQAILFQLRRMNAKGRWTREGLTFKDQEADKFLHGFNVFLGLTALSPNSEYDAVVANRSASWSQDRHVRFQLVNEKTRITFIRNRGDETGPTAVELTLEAEEAEELKFIMPVLECSLKSARDNLAPIPMPAKAKRSTLAYEDFSDASDEEKERHEKIERIIEEMRKEGKKKKKDKAKKRGSDETTTTATPAKREKRDDEVTDSNSD